MNEPPRSALAPERIRDRATWLLSRAYGRSTRLLNEAFEARGDGLRGYHYRLLAVLDEQGPASQADLGRSTGIDRSDITALLGQLEERGLIARSADPDDQRRNIVSISRTGTQRLGLLDDIVTQVQEQLLAPLSPTEQRQFFKLMGRLADAP